MVIVIFWIILCFVAAAVGDKRKIGSAGAFFLSLFLSPLVGLIIAFNSDKKVAVAGANPAMIKLIEEGDKLVKVQELNEAIQKYKSALTYSDKAPYTNFKLAKLFSLKQDTSKSLNHLAKAIQQGFKNFEEINHDKELTYLRSTKNYKQFLDNGYKMTIQPEVTKSLSRIEELEKLNALFEKGILTKDEFENEKKKILSKDN